MAIKIVEIPEVGTVELRKRKGTKHLKLSVIGASKVRVGMPPWLPYSAGIQFVRAKSQWVITQQQAFHTTQFSHGSKIGKFHYISYVPANGARTSSRIMDNEIRIAVPANVSNSEPIVQNIIQKAAVKALISEAAGALPYRLQTIAEANGFTYQSVAIKRLSGRWGSCSAKQEITLNCYLMQLPWHLIDYVIIHELVHTKIMAHGSEFWDEVSRYVPNLTSIRKEMRQHQPIISPQNPVNVNET